MSMRKKKKLVTRETVRKLAGDKLGGAAGASLVINSSVLPKISDSCTSIQPLSRVGATFDWNCQSYWGSC